MRRALRVCLAALLIWPWAEAARSAEKTSRNNALLRLWLKKHPKADANGDGVLTESESRAYLKRLVAEKVTQRGPKLRLPPGAVQKSFMVPMRDGVKLATEVFLPSEKGRWPVVLQRTPYGRLGAARQMLSLGLKRGYACVAQDMRGLHGSKGRFNFFYDDLEDGHDTVAWIARQPWCNGKVGAAGGSGPGIAAKLAMISNPPALKAVATVVAASSPYLHAAYHGGVLRANMHDKWLRQRGVEVKEWPKPRTLAFDAEQRALTLPPNAAKNDVALYDVAGWYDIFLQSALDDFMALRPKGKVHVRIGAFGHGWLGGLRYPAGARGKVELAEWLDYWLKGERNGVTDRPPLIYYLMGDTKNASAPGNVWKQTDTWPIPHKPTSFYMTRTGLLQRAKPADPQASLTYRYDPKAPVPTIGGANLMLPKGPMDQRPLRKRKDILRFQTGVLTRPLEITGRVLVHLHVSTDVADTTFMAKLIDVYPDGQEALVLDSAVMARYWQGLDKPAPLEKHKVYRLAIDLWSTALVFGKGHRIAVHVASSNSPRYEVHPNSYEPVSSYAGAPIATQRVHVSARHPSRVVLPVIAPGASKDYHAPGFDSKRRPGR